MVKLITAALVIFLTGCNQRIMTITEKSGQQYQDTINYRLVGGNSALVERRYQLKWYREHHIKPPVNPKRSLWRRTYTITKN